MIEPLNIKKGARLKRRDNFLQCHTHIHTQAHTLTHTHTQCGEASSTCLTQLAQVAPWETFSPHSTPVTLTRWHKMEDLLGFHVLQSCCFFFFYFLFLEKGETLSRGQPIIVCLGSQTPSTHSRTLLSVSYMTHTHTHSLSLSHTHTHTHTHAEVKPPPCTSSSSTWVWGRKWEGRKRRPGGERGVCFCWVLVPLNIRYR